MTLEDDQSEGLGPLGGLRILDLGHVISGPCATMMMADAGAEVIKIEPPEGEIYRRAGQMISGDGGDTNVNILRYSRGKKSVVLDMKTAEGQAQFAQLVRRCDVVVENFRPGVLERFGFGFDRLSELNNRVVYTTISGYGHGAVEDNPFRDRPAYALIAEAMAGITDLARGPDGAPVWLGFPMADIVSGILAFSGTLLALRERDRTGKAQRVDIALYDCALFLNDLSIIMHTVLNRPVAGIGHALQGPWNIYKANNGYLVVAAMTLGQWDALCTLIERPDLGARADLKDAVNRASASAAVIDPAIQAWTSVRSWEEAVERLMAVGIPAAPVSNAKDVIEGPQITAREMLLDVEDAYIGKYQMVGNPIRGSWAGPNNRKVPALGEHTASVTAELLD